METLDQNQAVQPANDALRGQIRELPSGELEAPKNIVRTLMAARSIFFKFRSEHLKRIHLYAAIHGLLAGNPPYDPAELQKHGLGWVSNFNDMSADSKVAKGSEALWNLVNEVEYLINYQIHYDDKTLNADPHLEEWQDIIAHEADDVIRGWRSFETVENTKATQLMELGVSPVFWPDPEDWHYRSVELSRFYIPDQTLTDLDRLSSCCVESFYDVQYLFQAYEHKRKNPKSSNWNETELKNLLLRQANTYYKAQGLPYNEMDAQRKLESGDLMWESAFTDNIRLVSLYYKEYDGKITHLMFHQTIGQQEPLFLADRIYESWDEALNIFTAHPGKFTIHENRGLGHKIFALAQATNQMHCSMVDAGRLAATVLLRSSPLQGHDASPLRIYPGGVSHIGTSEVVENQIGENVNQLVGLAEYFEGVQQRNIMNSGDDPAAPDADKGSVPASQARMMAFKEFGVLRNVVNHYYSSQDFTYQNIHRIWLRALSGNRKTWPAYKDAKRWFDRCVAAGVPKEVFEWDEENNRPRHLYCGASRVAGDGSTLARIMGLEAMQQIVGALGPDGVYEWQRQWIMATVGKHHVRAFLPSKEQMRAQFGGNSVAGVENAIMQMGKSPVMSLYDDHPAMLQTHLALANQVFGALSQQQMQPLEADRILSVLSPHMQEHFEAAVKNPFNKAFVEQFKPYLGQIVKLSELNRANAAKQLQAQVKAEEENAAATEAVMNEEQRKNMAAQGDEARATFKVNAQVDRAKEANATRAAVMRTKIERDAENARLKVQLEADAKKSESAKEQLAEMQGSTPAPYDIEKTPAPVIPNIPKTQTI